MHSLNQAVLGHVVAAERAGRPVARAVSPQPPERPPKTPLRARAAFITGRLARRLDHETARRAVI
jgi:hypothetical protein